MQDDFDLRTSATLLERVRVLQDQQAWNRFMNLYMPYLWAWGRRAGLPEHDVEELIGRLELRLVQTIPSFVYDPRKRFRGWLTTLATHELADMAREAARRLPGEKPTGSSGILDLLLQHPDGLDELVEGLEELSKAMAALLHDSMNAVRDSCQGDQQVSWEIFHRNIVMEDKITTVAKEFNLTVQAAGMRVLRMKRIIRAKITQLLAERAQIDADGQEKPQR